MDIVTWLKLGLAQALLYGIRILLENVASLQIPYPELVVPIIAAGLSAAATWIRNQFGIEATRKVARATRQGEPPLFARLFGV